MKGRTMAEKQQDRIGAAILGFYGAIRVCRQEGYDTRDIFELMNDDSRLEAILGGERIYDDCPKPTIAEQLAPALRDAERVAGNLAAALKGKE